MRPFSTLAAAAFALGTLAAPVWAQTEVSRTINVTGIGKVEVAPDMATIVIGVQSEAQLAAVAMDQTSLATAAILANLDVAGIAADDIRSDAVRLTPRYSQNVLGSGTQITGYQALNSIAVDVRDLDRLGGVLAAVVSEGANRVDRVQFGLQDPAAAEDEARRRAVGEATRLADLYAQAAGVTLGPLQSLSEGGSSGYRMPSMDPVMMEMAEASPQFDVPIAQGQIELSASVNMVFGIASP